MSFEWKSHPLHSVGRIVTGKTPSSNIEGAFDDQGIPFITPSDMDGRRCIDSTVRYLSEVGLEVSKKYLVPEGSVAVSCIGSDMGKAVLVGQDSVTNQQINTIIVDESQFNPVFVYYVLSTMQQELKNIASGSATPILNKTHFGNVEIRAPKRELQNKIVSILEPSDLKITLNTQTNQTLEQMAQALFKSWFVDFDPVIDNALDSGFFEREFEGEGIPEPLAKRVAIRQAVREGMRQALRQTMTEGARAATGAAAASQEPSAINASFSASLPADIRALFPASFVEHPDLGWIPEGWAVKTLAELAEKISKGTTPNKTDLSQAKDEPTVRFLKVKDMGDDGEIDISNLELISRSIHEGGLKRSILQRGDLLFSIAGTIGRVGQVAEELHDSNTNQAVAFIRLKDAQSHQEFVRQNLLSPRIQSDVTAKVVQGVQANVSLKSIGELAVCVPSVELLNVWNSSAFPLIRQIELQRRQSSSLANLRDTLLPKLLSGELTLAEA
ncbi:restriction endonuclease subunit S [Shewanella algae]|uniref:restriction endonuclease subunit S n=1 Tax=Shewanella algae TaxID=38313 RepID=UPI0031F482E4